MESFFLPADLAAAVGLLQHITPPTFASVATGPPAHCYYYTSEQSCPAGVLAPGPLPRSSPPTGAFSPLFSHSTPAAGRYSHVHLLANTSASATTISAAIPAAAKLPVLEGKQGVVPAVDIPSASPPRAALIHLKNSHSYCTSPTLLTEEQPSAWCLTSHFFLPQDQWCASYF